MARIPHTIFALALAACLPALASADDFYLVGDGFLQGELVNRDRAEGERYVVRLESGEIVLPASQVVRCRLLTDVEREYQARLADLPDTVEAHWELSLWCKDQQLVEPLQFHREQVIRLDPDHEEARQALGYRFDRGEWLLPAELAARRGLIDGQVAQAIEIEQRRHARDMARNTWARDIRDWRRDLTRSPERMQEALNNFRAIRDPAAGPALAEILADEEESEDMRMLMVEILGRLHSGTAVSALVEAAINDNSADVRYAAIEELERFGSAAAVTGFMKALESSDNRHINRGAIGLARLGDDRAVPALIEALVTTHRTHVRTGQAGAINPTFTPGGGGGLNVGGSGVRTVERTVQNGEVLSALLTLAPDAPRYNYDEDSWREWYIDEQTPQGLDLRRAD